MKVTCLNCGREVEINRVEHDEVNLEGFYAVCPECGSSFDLDYNIVAWSFITDIPKMADFKEISKEEFLSSYSYLTEEEYDATALYYEWLMREVNNG